MNNDVHLVCKKCGNKYDLQMTPAICPKCIYPLDIHIEVIDKDTYDSSLPGIYKYIPKKLYKSRKIVSLGEGSTPLVMKGNTLFKLEYLNPSGSFKDRGAASAVKIAYDHGYKDIVEDSSGNAGASISLYSKAYGMKAHIFIPRDAPEGKKRLIKLIGANLHLVETRGDAYKAAVTYAKENKMYYIGHVVNPLFNIGIESIAFELIEQFRNIDNIVVPLGSGGLYLGIYNGYRRIIELGLIDKSIPRLFPIEVEGYIRLQPADNIKKKSILGDGVRVPGPPRKDEVLNAMRETGGSTVWVTDKEIKKALKRLIKMGFIVEPTSAVAYAGYLKLIEYGELNKQEKSVIVLTGSGLKMINELLCITTSQPNH